MVVFAQLSVRRGGQMVLTSSVNRPVFTIGRLPSSDLVLPDTEVSPRHAEIRVESTGVAITDLESEGGTIVGGAPLLPLQPTHLADGTTIRIGPYEVVYRLHAGHFDEIDRPVSAPPSQMSAPRLDVAVDSTSAEPLRPPHAAVRSVPPGVYDPVAGRYLQFLPVIFHESDFLARFLSVFETIWEPLEQRQDCIAMYFSPLTCPAPWLPWLASWFGLDVSDHWPEPRVRAMLADATDLYRWRGTAYGLARTLEVCTGLKPEVTDSPTEPFVINVAVRIPPDARPDIVDTLHALIAEHKPAHAGYVLEVKR